jgi:hypothetical protein
LPFLRKTHLFYPIEVTLSATYLYAWIVI